MTRDASRPRRPARLAFPRKLRQPKWARAFLAELAVTSNVSAAARAAKVAKTTAYDARRNNAEFDRKWQQALCEGYDHLEMELLHRLRTGEVKPAPGAKRGTRTYDNATAFRLLSAHRESAARQRAIRSNEDSEAVLASLDAKLDRMRRHWLTEQGLDPDAEDAEDEEEAEGCVDAPAPSR
jgi:hypothetical protein